MSETLNRLREKRLKLEQDCADIRDTFTLKNDQIRESLRRLQTKLDERKQTSKDPKYELTKSATLTTLTTARRDGDQQTAPGTVWLF